MKRFIALRSYHFVIAVWRAKEAEFRRVMKYWEIIADNLRKAGWSWGFISSTGQRGRQFWVVALERKEFGRFIVRANEKADRVSGTPSYDLACQGHALHQN
jgi:hypothetical protein